jgi:hypothetical protein
VSDLKPKSKRIEYDVLIAEIDYKERLMVLTEKITGASIEIHADAYVELQAILTDLGRQVPTVGPANRTR